MTQFMNIFKSFIPGTQDLSKIPSLSSNLSSIWMFGALGIVAVCVLALSIGRTKAVVSLLSLYIAFALEITFPYWKFFKNMAGNAFEDYWLRLFFFIAAYALVFLMFNFSFIKKRVSSAEFSLFAIIALSILQFAMAGSIIFNILPSEIAIKWLPGLYYFLGTKEALFVWLVIPLPALMFMGK